MLEKSLVGAFDVSKTEENVPFGWFTLAADLSRTTINRLDEAARDLNAFAEGNYP